MCLKNGVNPYGKSKTAEPINKQKDEKSDIKEPIFYEFTNVNKKLGKCNSYEEIPLSVYRKFNLDSTLDKRYIFICDDEFNIALSIKNVLEKRFKAVDLIEKPTKLFSGMKWNVSPM